MKSIPQYSFHKKKYGDELLIDVVDLHFIKKYTKNIPSHTLTYYDITFITEGSGFFRIDDKSYTVQPNEIIFSVPGEVRSWDKENIIGGHALIFEEEFLLSFFNDPAFIRSLSYFQSGRETALLSLDDGSFRELTTLVARIRQEILQYRNSEKHILRAMLYEALALIDREYRKQKSRAKVGNISSNRHATSFAALVENHYLTTRHINFYADKLCLTPNYLNEKVQQAFGVSTKCYIQNRLLIEAKRLLQYTDKTVLDISESLAFENSSYFIRFFRKHTGMTPLKFRNKGSVNE